MRMKKLVSRPKKQDRAHSKRARTAIAGLGVVLAVTGAIAASRLVSPARSTAATTPTLSPDRIAENRKAQAELGPPTIDYAGTGGTAVSPAAAKSPSVTLTGCLEQHGDDFRLKDAAGADAPKSRSWKSGFLKKSTPTLDVVDASHRLKLKDHVGQRVSVSGVLVEHEVRARTLKNVSSSCTN